MKYWGPVIAIVVGSIVGWLIVYYLIIPFFVRFIIF